MSTSKWRKIDEDLMPNAVLDEHRLILVLRSEFARVAGVRS